MRARFSVLSTVCAGALLGACATDSGTTGPQVKIATAPLQLASIVAVDYGITVYNGDPQFDTNGNATSAADVVWTKGSVTSTDYGNGPGGAITYIGPCDASVPNNNYVALVLNSIMAGSPSAQLSDQNTIPTPAFPDFKNPCPSNAPCVLDFECVENADVAVEFNLTIMRRAMQGFFDIAVNFEDVFCSAKFDSCYGAQMVHYRQDFGNGLIAYAYQGYPGHTAGAMFSNGTWSLVVGQAVIASLPGDASQPPASFTVLVSQGDIGDVYETYTPVYLPSGGTPIELLYGPNGREHTAVAAVACTVGADTGEVGTAGDLTTELLLVAPTIMCDGDVTFTLDLTGLDGGNHSQAADGEDPENPDHTIAFGLYFGNEDLDCGEGPGSCNKVYYNIAFNIQNLADQGLTNCNLYYGATATEAASNAMAVPADATPREATGATGTPRKGTFAGGQLVDPNAVYGGVSFGYATGGVPLTSGDSPSCVTMPLGGFMSGVTSEYIKGSAYGEQQGFRGFSFYTSGGKAQAFGRSDVVVPIDKGTQR